MKLSEAVQWCAEHVAEVSHFANGWVQVTAWFDDNREVLDEDDRPEGSGETLVKAVIDCKRNLNARYSCPRCGK